MNIKQIKKQKNDNQILCLVTVGEGIMDTMIYMSWALNKTKSDYLGDNIMLILLISLILGTFIGTLVIKYNTYQNHPEYSWDEYLCGGTVVGVIATICVFFLYSIVIDS